MTPLPLHHHAAPPPSGFELCVDYSAPAGLLSCKGLRSGADLATIDLAGLAPGPHTFRAFLRPAGVDLDPQVGEVG